MIPIKVPHPRRAHSAAFSLEGVLKMRTTLMGWLRARIERVTARLDQRVDQSWRKRAKESYYDPVRELQMFGDLLDPAPETLVRPADFTEAAHSPRQTKARA